MSTENFSVKISFTVNNIIDHHDPHDENSGQWPGSDQADEILDPIVTISANDSIYKEKLILNEPNSNGFVECEFDLDIDDDIDQSINLQIKLVNENIPIHREWGLYISDIELNEISVESLVHQNGIIDVPLCDEADYDDEGFIHSYLVPEGLMDGLKLIDGKYHFINNGDYIHMQDSSYSFTFKTPLYLWLLELLLQ